LVEGHAVIGLIDEAFAPELEEGAADSFAGETGHAAELFMGELHEEGDGEIGVGGAIVEVVHAGPVEKGAGELAGGGGVESEATGGKEGAVVLTCDGQGGGAADVGMGFHEVDEVGAGDGLDGAGAEGLYRDTVECVRAQSGEAEDVSGAGNAEQEETAIGGGGGDFDAACADDQEMVSGEAFADEDSVCLAMAADTDGVEIVKDVTGERTGVLRISTGVLQTRSRSFYKAARKDGGPPETQRESRLRYAELKRPGAHSAVSYPQVIAPRPAQIYVLPKHRFSPQELDSPPLSALSDLH
jgi:hypothetical protein